MKILTVEKYVDLINFETHHFNLDMLIHFSFESYDNSIKFCSFVLQFDGYIILTGYTTRAILEEWGNFLKRLHLEGSRKIEIFSCFQSAELVKEKYPEDFVEDVV